MIEYLFTEHLIENYMAVGGSIVLLLFSLFTIVVSIAAYKEKDSIQIFWFGLFMLLVSIVAIFKTVYPLYLYYT